MADMRDANADARTGVMKVLNEEQQKKAAEFENDARKDAESKARRQAQDMGMGGDRRGMGRPPED